VSVGRAAMMVRKLSPSINTTHSGDRMRDISAKRYRDGFRGRLTYVDMAGFPYFHNNIVFTAILDLGLLMHGARKARLHGDRSDLYIALAPFFGW
jgi:hypothetical protein